MIPIAIAFIVLCTGCQKQPPSTIPPVHTSELSVKHCTIDGEPTELDVPISAKPSQHLEFHASIEPKSLGLSAAVTFWPPRPGESQEVTASSSKLGDPSLLFFLDIFKSPHRSEPVQSELVEVKQVRSTGGLVLRKGFRVPKHSGDYTIDLRVVNQSAPESDQGRFTVYRVDLRIK